MFKKKTNQFVSEIDRFLEAFDRANPPSESQKAAIEKHNKISELRDNLKKES